MDSDVEGLCHVIHKPSGTIPNLNAGTAAGQPAMIPNPGNQVSKQAETNLKLACYLIRYCKQISHEISVEDITLNCVHALCDLKEVEEDHKDHEVPENLINSKDWPKSIERLQEYLQTCLGVSKILLQYVVRDKIDVPDEEGDLATNYATPQDEMIAQALIKDDDGNFAMHFLTDCETVWEKILKLTHDQSC